jgi:sulfur carrier protein
VEITLNGETKAVQEGTTLAALLRELNQQPRYVAVERNLDLVPRAQHADCVLQPGDRLEIVTLVGGG